VCDNAKSATVILKDSDDELEEHRKREERPRRKNADRRDRDANKRAKKESQATNPD